MIRIFEISDLEELRAYLSDLPDRYAIREHLYAEFLKYSRYRNVEEWNTAVRICEALAIIGWGTHEPVEAIRGMWFNGNPETYFINRYAKPRFFDAVWSKRKDGFAIDYSLSTFHETSENTLAESVMIGGQIGKVQNIPITKQRNWIAKNPIRIIRGLANCYENSRPLIESIEGELIPDLNRGMRPELYGPAIDSIVINLSFSFYDNYHCKTNYIIADESLKLRQKDFYPKLLEMYSEQEINDNGYYLRNRYTYCPFHKDSGTTRVNIVLEKEFSQLSHSEQKLLLSEYLIHAVEQIALRLNRKISYDFSLMISDFKLILQSWLGKE
ncbi:MAG: hypothetical protein NC349_00785 [Paenibacillus sp.]|nr:hypothetical protein [Paenibacillus sp.]